MVSNLQCLNPIALYIRCGNRLLAKLHIKPLLAELNCPVELSWGFDIELIRPLLKSSCKEKDRLA